MKTKKRRWTQEEINLMYNAYGHVPVKWIADELGRTYDSVRAQAKVLRLTKWDDNGHDNIWTDEEDKYLAENYHKVPRHLISLKLNRSIAAIANHARILGVAKPQWTPDKVKALQKNLNTKSVDKICKFFEENA